MVDAKWQLDDDSGFKLNSSIVGLKKTIIVHIITGHSFGSIIIEYRSCCIYA